MILTLFSKSFAAAGEHSSAVATLICPSSVETPNSHLPAIDDFFFACVSAQHLTILGLIGGCITLDRMSEGVLGGAVDCCLAHS